jgi:Ferritin-like domain
MSETVDLLAFDRDGALEESAEKVGVSRGHMLRMAAIGGGALLGSSAFLGALAGPAGAVATASAGDVAILNYALTLEYLEEAFYSSVQSNRILTGRMKTFAEVAGRDEAQHRAFLVKALGPKAIKKPVFDFGSATTGAAAFAKTAIALEDTGVSAYAGQGPRIQDKKILAAALSVHSVEARHAAWIRALVNATGRQGAPAPAAFDPSRSMTQVLAIVKGTHFIT